MAQALPKRKGGGDKPCKGEIAVTDSCWSTFQDRALQTR